MSEAIRFTLIGLSLILVAVGGYHRVQSQQSGEPLDRTKEGWPLLIGIRVVGVLTFGSTGAWLWNPAWLESVTLPMPEGARWVGVTGFACAVA